MKRGPGPLNGSRPCNACCMFAQNAKRTEADRVYFDQCERQSSADRQCSWTRRAASLMKILHAMQAHGYRIEGLPDASDQLMQQLINQGSYDEDFLTAEQMRAAVARVPAD